MNEAAPPWTSRGKCVSLLMGNNPVIEGHSASEGPETPPQPSASHPTPRATVSGSGRAQGGPLTRRHHPHAGACVHWGRKDAPRGVHPQSAVPKNTLHRMAGGLCRRHRGHRSKNGETLDLLGGPILITGTLKSREPSPAGSRRDGRRGGQRSGHEDPACC